MKTILLDMDGVLADFVQMACAANGRMDITCLWPDGKTGLHDALGLSMTSFWEGIDACGEGFWSQMGIYPWALELWRHCNDVADEVHILTSPSQNPQSLSGKLRWMNTHFGPNFRNFLVGPQKHLCAKPNTLLIDDRSSNCRKFREHGGRAILFPQPWNENAGEIRHLIATSETYMAWVRRAISRQLEVMP